MQDSSATEGPVFLKMHGLGNDFVVIDRRGMRVEVSPRLARRLADRHRGIGFDQLAVVDSDTGTGARLTFFNADGSRAGACGNATRCIARFLMEESGATALRLRTERGVLDCRDAGAGMTAVNMGTPILDWREIPLADAVDPLHLPIDGDPVATSMGNPHCTFFVADAEAVDLPRRGAEVERHPIFPARTNVQFAQLVAPDHLRVRVWERGVGVTLASGSSSCAVAVAAARRGVAGRRVRITLDGGDIGIDWRDDGVWMTGPTAHVFTGRLSRAFMEEA